MSSLDPCIRFVGRHDVYGYGVRVGGESAHRYAYRTERGAIPAGYSVHHVCGVRDCINPSHLEAITQAEHARIHGMEAQWTRAAEIKGSRTHCEHGHEFTPENTRHRAGQGRVCRKCDAERQRRYKQRKREARA